MTQLQQSRAIKFEFAKYCDITDYANTITQEYVNNKYSKIFLCIDSKDIWIVRLLPDVSEGYTTKKGAILLERNNHARYIYMGKGRVLTVEKLNEIIEEDSMSLENWDCKEYSSMDNIMTDLDDGFGIDILDPETLSTSTLV